jgi:hypothetical protein
MRSPQEPEKQVGAYCYSIPIKLLFYNNDSNLLSLKVCLCSSNLFSGTQ